MPKADLIIKNTNIITMDSRQPAAGWVAVDGDRISAVGFDRDFEAFKSAKTKVIDGEGKTLIPGFNDAHCHVFSFINKLLSVDLSPESVKSIADIKSVISLKAKNTPKSKWISGTDYNDFYLAEKRHPTRQDIDEVAPDHPVVLCHKSLHACVLNSTALAMAGITRETPEPAGGLIDRDTGTGEPTGILFDMLGYVRKQVMPPFSEKELEQGVKLANRHYLSQGITSLGEATLTNDLDQWKRYGRFINSGKLKSRLYMMTGIEFLGQLKEAGLSYGSGDNRLKLGAVKIIINEATGRLYPPQEELNEQVLAAHNAGFQVAMHAVQESTVEAAITALEYVQSRSPKTGTRHRIEHCAECPPHLLERLKRLQAVVVSQPPFIYYSGERYLATVAAEQQPWLYRFKSFIDSALMVGASSDSPVVPDNPLMGIYAAVTRQAASRQKVLPHEAISGNQALEMYTKNAAYATFEENIKGSITPGKVADFVLLTADPTRVPAEQIKDIKVEMTVTGGKVVWEG